jgi:hypothetical protein
MPCGSKLRDVRRRSGDWGKRIADWRFCAKWVQKEEAAGSSETLSVYRIRQRWRIEHQINVLSTKIVENQRSIVKILFSAIFVTPISKPKSERLRWSRGNMLAFGTQVRGFAPGRSRRIFRAKNILSTPSFGEEVKPSVPCRSFTACKRSLNITSAFRQNYRTFLAHSSTFRRWVLSRGDTRGNDWWRKLERLTKIAI